MRNQRWPLILFRKSLQGELFEELVPVKGHTTAEGSYVRPHYARRRKKHEQPSERRHGRSGESGQSSTTRAENGRAAPRLARLFDERGNPPNSAETLSEEAGNVVPKAEPEQDSPVTYWRQAAGAVLGTGLDYTRPFHDLTLPDIGVPAGTTKAQRRKLNAEAIRVLEFAEQHRRPLEPYQKEALARYSGRGGCGDSLNEFYTRPDVAAGMWRVLASLGITSGSTVLEPSCGTGVFLSTKPRSVAVDGVELDQTSAGIAKVLHLDDIVQNKALEYFATMDPTQYDAVIGNAPFGIRGATIKADKPYLKTAEQYFLDTAIDKCRAGGVVAMIVPTGIMDATSVRKFRGRLLRKAEFLGALRLPNSAFAAAHTRVTTDIVFFRKRAQDAANALSVVPDAMAKELGVWDEEFIQGDYFGGRGEGNVLGAMEAGWRAKAGMGNDITVSGTMDGVAAKIAAFVPEEPLTASPSAVEVVAAAGDDERMKKRLLAAAIRAPYEFARLGDTKTVEGVTYMLRGEPPRWHRIEEEPEDSDAVAAGKELAASIQLYILDQHDDARGLNREQIIGQLNAYIAAHGNPAKSKEILEAAKRDKGLWKLIGAVRPDGSYSDAITGRTEESNDDADFDRVAQRLLIENRGFTADEIAGIWTGGDRAEALDRLFASPNYAVGADGQRWTTLDEYLSGELWPKLDAARAALEHDGLSDLYKQKYQAQANALEAAIDPRSLEDVEVTMASGWVPLPVLKAFLDSRIDAWKEEHPGRSWTPNYYEIEKDGPLYIIHGGLGAEYSSKLLQNYLNRLRVAKDEWPQIDRVNQEFKRWLLGSEFRDEVEALYNRKYRGYRQQEYSEAPLAVPGFTADRQVNPYVNAAVRWALGQGKGIIAADVGLGKTVTALMVARLAKSWGQAKKPLFVVPKSVLANWVAECEQWFPGCRVLTIGETYTRDKNGDLKAKADSKEERDRKLHELAQNDYDFVLMSAPAWNDLDLDPITKGGYVQEDFWVQRADALDKASGKKKEKIRQQYQQAVAGRDFRKRTDVIYLNDLGVDMLIVDEAHAMKNLHAARNRRGFSPKFLGGSGQSNRAFDTNLKARWIEQENDGKNVYMLTATPTKNSPLEIYSMLSHISPEEFTKRGIANSEDFIDRYCEFCEDAYMGTSGQVEDGLITVGFKNLDEVRQLMHKYINRKTAEDVGLELPEREDQQHMVDMTPEQEAAYQRLREEAETGKDADGADAHIFSTMDKMAKASIDLDLLTGGHGAKSPKIESCAKEAATRLKDGGQLIFADHVDVHQKIADALVSAGVPREKIAICNAQVANTSAKRQNISDKFNAGRYSVVIGNRTMEEGMNLQKRTSDIHHLELPWEPASLQQRNGRGLRQGNTNKGVNIHTYLAKRSFDAYRYQTIGAKKDWQDLLWSGGDKVENLAREGAFSRDEMMILLAADPEQARAAYAANKALAAEKAETAGREHAAAEFGRLRTMQRSWRGLKNRETTAGRRLSARIEALHAQLRADRYFTAKEALDSTEPLLVQPQTGHIWQAGQAFVMPGGEKAPLYVSDDPVRMVVTGINPDTDEVSVRRYGNLSETPKTVPLERLNGAYERSAYSAEDEIGEAAKSESGLDSVMSLKGIAPQAIARHYGAIQTALKAAMRDYRDRGYRALGYPLITADGAPALVPSYDARHEIDDKDLMLPIPEHREKAVSAWVAAAQSRQAETNVSNGFRSQPGIRFVYPDVSYAFRDGPNPWTGPMTEIFGAEAVNEARERLVKEQLAAAAKAKDFGEVFRALLPLADGAPAGGLRFRPRAIAALRAAAKKDKIEDSTIEDIAAAYHWPRGPYTHSTRSVAQWLKEVGGDQ